MERRALIVFLSLGFCLILLVSCKKKDSSPSGNSLGSYSFSAQELAILPYPTHDTLIFKSTEGDSIVFKYSGRSSMMKTYYQNPGNPTGYQGNFYTCEVNSSGFISPNSDYLFFNLHFTNPFLGYGGTKLFNIGVASSDGGSCNFSGEFRFEADTLISYLPDSSFTSGGYVKSLYKTLALGPRLFENVYELVGPGFTNYCPVFFSRVYYSINEGIVGFAQNTGKTWFLLPVKINPSRSLTPSMSGKFVKRTLAWCSNAGFDTTTKDVICTKKLINYYINHLLWKG